MSLTTTYTVNGSITFTRVLSSADFKPWFNTGVEVTKDVPLGAVDPSDSYIDIGAFSAGPLEMRASFSSQVARSSLSALLGQVVTLINTRGRSASALLISADEVDSGQAGLYYLDVKFEAR
jgi:hypothetical protein